MFFSLITAKGLSTSHCLADTFALRNNQIQYELWLYQSARSHSSLLQWDSYEFIKENISGLGRQLERVDHIPPPNFYYNTKFNKLFIMHSFHKLNDQTSNNIISVTFPSPVPRFPTHYHNLPMKAQTYFTHIQTKQKPLKSISAQ